MAVRFGADSSSSSLVFRGLALTQLQRLDEAEKVSAASSHHKRQADKGEQSYLHAYKLNPNNPLASVGLRRLYDKDQNWEKLATLLEVQVQTAFEK